MYTRWLPFLNKHTIILASGSVQRQQLLKELGFQFQVKTSDFPEDLEKSNPQDYVEKTCFKKFEEFLKNNPKLKIDILITADTIIEHNGVILEKPNNDEEIYKWLNTYSNSSVTCYSSVVIGLIHQCGEDENEIMKSTQFTTKTKVVFDEITNDMIADYIKTGEPYGRAGAFAIQGIGRTLIKAIEGCYYNVVGFPVHDFTKNLVKFCEDVFGKTAWTASA